MTIRCWSKLEKMSKDRSPKLVCPTTIGTRLLAFIEILPAPEG
jgi:hypothetical protein